MGQALLQLGGGIDSVLTIRVVAASALACGPAFLLPETHLLTAAHIKSAVFGQDAFSQVGFGRRSHRLSGFSGAWRRRVHHADSSGNPRFLGRGGLFLIRRRIDYHAGAEGLRVQSAVQGRLFGPGIL